MVLAAKIFRVRGEITLDDAAAKLKGFRREEPYEEGSFKDTLLTEIQDLKLQGNILKGVHLRDKILHVSHHDQLKPVPKTVETTFTFTNYHDAILLTLMEKKWEANLVANQMSEALFITMGNIVEAHLSPETLQRYHEDNPEGTKVMFFDNVDLPNINKLSLYGPDLINSNLYIEYLKHGKIWYAVVTSRKHGYIIGLTRNAIVTVFNRIDPNDFLAYIEQEIHPLLQL